MTVEINREIAVRVLEIVDCGLVSGLGVPEPGKLCVEAAVCLAMGLPHSDEPSCVSPALRKLKINLNDRAWSSNAARARGLRRLALVQLGSAGALDEREFAKRVAEFAIRKMVPIAFRAAASIQKDATHRQKLLDAANRCEVEGTRAAAYAAADAAAYAAADAADYAAAAAADYAADYAADAAAAAAAAADYAAYAANAADYAADAAKSKRRDEILSDFAEAVVQILIDLDAPGCQWLELAPVEKEVA